MAELSALNVRITGDATDLRTAAVQATTSLKTVEDATEGAAKKAIVLKGDLDKLVDATEKVSVKTRKFGTDMTGLYPAIDTTGTKAVALSVGLDKLGDEAVQTGAELARVGQNAVQTGNALAVAQTKTTAMGASLGRLSSLSGNARAQIQNVGYNIADMAVQFDMGTKATTIFAQQGSQILGAFGPVGAILGAMAAITLPLLGAALSSGGAKAATLEDAMGRLGEALDAYEGYTAVASASTAELTEKFGEFAGQIRGFSDYMASVSLGRTFDELRGTIDLVKGPLAEVQAAMMQVAEAQAYLDSIPKDDVFGILNAQDALALFQEKLDETARKMGLLPEEALRLAAAIDQIRPSDSLEDMARAAANALAVIRQIEPVGARLPAPLRAAAAALEDMAKRAADAASAGWDASAAMQSFANLTGVAETAASGLLSRVQAVASAAWDMAGALGEAQRMADPANFKLAGAYGLYASTRRAAPAVAPVARPESGGGGGGAAGAAGENPLVADIEQLREQLLTKEQLEIESYARQHETLLAAYEQKLITQEEYNALLQSSELNHANEMALIKEREAEMVRSAARGMYGELEGLLGAFGQKSKAAAILAIALNKGLRIAEIIQNTAAAQMRAYAELGPVAGAAAAAKIGAYGKIQAGIVAATGLMQAGGGGGGGSGGGSSIGSGSDSGGAAAAPAPLDVRLTGGLDPRTLYTGRQISELLEALTEEAGGRGFRLVVAR